MIMKIGEKIKKLRQDKNLSQADLGQIIGVHEKHISRYERGISQLSVENLRKMAEVFGVSVDYLIGEISDSNVGAEDKELQSYFEEVNQLGEEDKKIIKGVLDAILFKAKMQRK
jgi:transcriptional regulator with XRE-family HTH domain